MFHVKRGGMTFSFFDFFLFGEKKKSRPKKKSLRIIKGLFTKNSPILKFFWLNLFFQEKVQMLPIIPLL